MPRDYKVFLRDDGRLSCFCYTCGARKTGFRPFRCMEKLDQVYKSEELFHLFQPLVATLPSRIRSFPALERL